jgi:hypothetical protein
MDGISSKLESLLQFLAEWEAEHGTSFWGLMTAGQLADVQELDRMFALGCEEPFPAFPCTALTVRRRE